MAAFHQRRHLLLLPLLLAAAWAQCPLPAELKNPDGTKICSQLYTDNSPYYDQCCAGSALVVQPGEDHPFVATPFNNKISSLVVAPWCELTVWSKKGKAGNTRKFKSGVFYRLQEYKRGLLFGTWDNSISAFYCSCTV